MTSARINGIALLMVLSLLTACGSYFDGTVTVYPVGDSDTKNPIPLNRTVYKVSFDTQTVVYRMPGLFESPAKLFNCAVRDKYNRRCRYPETPSWEIRMVDGEIADHDPDVKYVSSIYWHYLNSKGKF